ncbi:hypothetical protein FZ934_25510 (plasmid) [Rhizobium grahamii]|uniref:Uncharacterized protein n=1 Tax=Rhizobium grahamii TaxID=1120045 RepID=A0A5Q0CHE6_9HYPH|nr:MULTISPECIES: hypothetical protein [Rhizobium]QFY63599.1 hypothetical protein FZ934_25510 [Rhizobium grahamii]QRM51637.1 hypothetical protein F3Y33_20135 [Rhizobium sp. BG6]
MNRISSFAIAAAFSTLAFASASYADSLTMNDGPQIEKTLATFDQGFNVKYINDYQNQKDQPDAQDTAAPRTDEGVQHIQAAIKSNKPLSEKLASKGIAVDNVVNVEQAADGSMTFWIR